MSMKIAATCPECGYLVDDASGLGDAAGDRPEPGNAGLCIRCAGIGIYFENEDGTLGLRQPTDEEKVELSEETDIQKVRAAILINAEKWFQS